MKAGRIDVTGVSIADLIRFAYEPSEPRGLGMLHFKPGGLSDADVERIMERGVGDRFKAVSMDYVNGRSCKFDVYRDGDKLYIKNRWYDHSDGQLRALLAAVGLSPDLVEKAREEEAQYIASAIADAVAFLKERDGLYIDRNTRETNELPPKIFDGLIYGSDPGPIKREWNGAECRYSLTIGFRGET